MRQKELVARSIASEIKVSDKINIRSDDSEIKVSDKMKMRRDASIYDDWKN